MNGTEAELGPRTGETGAMATEKCPLTGLNRRSDMRHGNGHLARPGYRRIAEHSLRPRVQPQCSNSPPGRWRPQERIGRANGKAGNDKDDLPPSPNRPGAAYIELCKNSPTGIGGR